MSRNLILQILGNNDVQIGDCKGNEKLKKYCSSYENLRKEVESYKNEYLVRSAYIDFPLLTELKKNLETEENVSENKFCILLTNQTE